MPDENPLAPDLAHILEHTVGLWESLRGENIFVTGGTGFFGRWLLESFAHANKSLDLKAHLVVLSRDAEAFRARAPHLFVDGAIEFVAGDVRAFTVDDFRAQLPERQPRFGFVIHAATEASAALNAEDPLRMFDTIVQGTRAVLEFSVATGVRRFLLTSSGAIYGKQPAELTHIPEEFAGAPDCTDISSAYAEGKRAAEFLCVGYGKQHNIEALIARCFAFVGPFLPLDAHFAVGNFIRDARAGGPIRIAGDGTPFRSYLYAADMVIWLWTILLKGAPARAYNVGSSRDLPIIDIAEAVRSAVDEGVKITIAKQAHPDAAASRYVPATTRAERELALAERIPLQEAIRRTAAYIRNSGAFRLVPQERACKEEPILPAGHA